MPLRWQTRAPRGESRRRHGTEPDAKARSGGSKPRRPWPARAAATARRSRREPAALGCRRHRLGLPLTLTATPDLPMPTLPPTGAADADDRPARSALLPRSFLARCALRALDGRPRWPRGRLNPFSFLLTFFKTCCKTYFSHYFTQLNTLPLHYICLTL